MASEVKEVMLKDVCISVYSGGTPRSTVREYFDGGRIPWLKTKEVRYQRIYATESQITEAGLKNSSAKLVPPNSVIVAMYGDGDTAGRVAINKIALTTNQACCNLIINPSVADYRFIYYLLRGRYDDLVGMKNGGGQQNLNAQLIKSFNITLPPKHEQQSVADLLEAVDDKIDLLVAQNKAHESIAGAIFKSWFVDFDPVRAKAEGREPEGMDAATAALFPDGLSDSEFGLVPSGWCFSPFDEVVTVTSGGTPKTTREDYWGGEIPWFSIADAPTSSDVFVIKTEKQITSAGLSSCAARLLPVGATIISARGTVGKVAITGVEMAINQSCYALLPSGYGTYGTFFQTLRLVDSLKQRAHGAVFSTVTRDTLASLSVVVPSRAIAAAFEEAVGALMQRLLMNRNMAYTLAELRDTLLPRLISGKLRIPEVEKMVEAVL